MKHKSFAPWLVALVCFGPFAAALFIYYGPLGPSWLPQLPGSRELLAAPLPLPPDWRGAELGSPGGGRAPPAWQLIYARMSPCAQQCAQHLGRLLQVQLALGRDRDRVRRVVWHVGDLPQLDDPELAAYRIGRRGGPWRGRRARRRAHRRRPRVRGRSAR